MATPRNNSSSLTDLLETAHVLAADLRLRAAASDQGSVLGHLRGDFTALIRCAELVLAIDAAETDGFEHAQSPSAVSHSLVMNIGRLQAQGVLALHRGRLVSHADRISIPFKIEHIDDGEMTLLILAPRLEQSIPIVVTRPGFGGERYWFLCPGLPGSTCGRRVMHLYQPSRFARFACRTCHPGKHTSANQPDAAAPLDLEVHRTARTSTTRPLKARAS